MQCNDNNTVEEGQRKAAVTLLLVAPTLRLIAPTGGLCYYSICKTQLMMKMRRLYVEQKKLLPILMLRRMDEGDEYYNSK